VKEEDLQKMVYLKAVVLEGLRRHPPGHFLLPHTVSEDTELNGYCILTQINLLVFGSYMSIMRIFNFTINIGC
jgi:cytochrome P450 family 89 subfamily A